jgi:hypothetical protein
VHVSIFENQDSRFEKENRSPALHQAADLVTGNFPRKEPGSSGCRPDP